MRIRSSPIGPPHRVKWNRREQATAGHRPMPRTRAQIPQRIAALVASAIANVQAWSELEASRVRIVTAADEARQRVMRDLHDGSQHGLSHSRLRLRCLRSLRLRGPPAPTASFEAL